MTIALTGASGFVGRHIVAELLQRGQSARVLTRSASRAARALPADERVEFVEGDLFDDQSVRQLIAGADACIHLVGIIRERPGGQTFRRVHVEATRAIAGACERLGVRRFIHMSAIAADPGGKAEYQRTKFEAEQIVESSGLDWTIFRPGLIHGADGEFMQMVEGWCEGRRFPFVFMPFFYRCEQHGAPGPINPPRLVEPRVAPVHVDDVAKLFADALTTPESIGEIYRITGPEVLTFPEMLRFVRDTDTHGKKGLPPIGVPGVLAAAQAWKFKLLGLGELLPFDTGMARMGALDAICDNGKAYRHLGFEPRAFRSSARVYITA
ncbi:MAG: complex I NDUFA9 subunit family protein [Phycisphaeraceae bacterium]|nr:MAG: complex I NDUFA9 subunit family protein [Phycisphaeraceae bacterium]